MMLATLPDLNALPRRNATHVKNKWGEVVRQVLQEGSVAVTNHSAIEMVLIPAAKYDQLTREITQLQAREQDALHSLTDRFDQRLAKLQDASAAAAIQAVMDAKGKLKKRPKVGESF